MTFEIFIFKFPDTKIYPFWCAVLRVGKFIVINHHCNPDKELCYHPLKMPTFPGTASSVVRSHRVINPWSILCSYSFAFSRTSYKWSHENVAFWGAHLAECTGMFVAAACSGSLPLSVTEYSVVRVGHSLFMLSAAEAHSGCFWVLAVWIQHSYAGLFEHRFSFHLDNS